MNRLESFLKKERIPYFFKENYPEELISMGIDKVYVLPREGLIFDLFMELDYNKIKELELLNYRVYQLNYLFIDLNEIKRIIQ